MDVTSAFRTFIRVAETESFSAAASELKVGQPAVSKQISMLEDFLGTRLFQRSTRGLSLTEDGVELLDHARIAVDAVDEAVEHLREKGGHVSGVLRMTTTASFGRMHIVPRLPLLREQYPDLRIDLLLQDNVHDMVELGLDLSIRFGEPKEPDLVARRLARVPFVIVAHKDYLERYGRPEKPEDLASHRVVAFAGDGFTRWNYRHEGDEHSVPVDWQLRTDNSDAIREAAISGVGIARVPLWILPDLWELEDMVLLFRDYDFGELPMYAVYPSRRFVPPKVRAMVEFLEHEIRLDPSMTGKIALV